MNATSLARIVLAFLAALGSFAGGRLTIEHLQHGEVCPMLGPIPACIIVFLGYLAILLATVFIKHARSKSLFYLGWTPVFFLALAGVTLELTKGETCPPGAAGIPQCFFSLAMVVLAFVLFRFVQNRFTRHRRNKSLPPIV